MFDNILKLVLSEMDADRAFNDLVARWEIDRWFSFSGMLRSCEYDVAKMVEYGFDDARVEKYPADGKTQFGYWTMPLAWDPVDATLTITSPASRAGKVLASYKSIPCSLVMWTPSTPKGGIEGEIVAMERGDSDEDYAGVNVKGKFLLTSRRAAAVRAQAIKRGALGIISDTSRWPHEMPDAVDWMNAWSEDPCGWGLLAGDNNILAFNISHRRGRELRALCGRGAVRVKAVAQTKLYKGAFPAAVGAIAGTTNEEVLTLGHGAEQGAVDNSSGCSVMLEALRILKTLIDAGKLPRPKRTIRMLVSWEVYATLAFVAKHRARAKRTVAAVCIDSVAGSQRINATPLGLHRNPHANSSCTDTLMALIAEKTWPAPDRRHYWCVAPYSMTDNVTAHPGIGIPTPWLGMIGHRQWHTNMDTPDKVDVEALGRISALVAAYLYFLANAGEREASWMADATSADWRMQLARAGVELSASLDKSPDAAALARTQAAGLERVEYLRMLGKKAIVSSRRFSAKKSAFLDRDVDQAVNMLNEAANDEREHVESTGREIAERNGWRLALPDAEPSDEMKRAAAMIVERAEMGPIAFDGIPLSKRVDLDDTRWGGQIQTVLMWCDGKRTLAEAVRLASLEASGPMGKDIVDQIERCAKLGLVRIRKA